MSQDLRTTFNVGPLTVEITEGDITRADAEAITNAANNHLYMGAGVAGAIKRAGGPAVEREAVAKGPIPIGSAVETTAGDLPYKYVLHGAVMGTDLRTDADLIARTTTACLELADKLELTSLALPAFGTGVGGFSMEECGRIMADAVRKFADAGPSHLRRVLIVLWGESAYNAFLSGARAALEGES
ncbi:MAG: macro domain-containing protein [Armatimonadetes bacterium]|nr:macro domain-containing protein [Armatimonadota bacterium]